MHRIGIYSGTFDPIHDGHVAFAEIVHKNHHLDEVIFLPEPHPRNKKDVSPVAERIAEINSRLQGMMGYSVVQLPDPQFTVQETLPKLRLIYPNADLTFLLGSDVAAHLADWPAVATLLNSCTLAVGMRENDDEQSLHNYLQSLFAAYQTTTPLFFYRTEYHHLRSSAFRDIKSIQSS